MEKKEYRQIAEDVKSFLRDNPPMHNRLGPFVGACQRGALRVYNELVDRGESPRIVKLILGYDGPYGVKAIATHIVATADGYDTIIDPTITQLKGDEKESIFPWEDYPLRIVNAVDITHSSFFNPK